MVVYRWGKRVPAADLAWVSAPNGDPQVDYAARYADDYTYEGAGNWPFNTAYAAGFGLSAHVTRLTSPNAVLPYLRAGIPLVVSVRFTMAELPEAGYATNGHRLVIVGSPLPVTSSSTTRPRLTTRPSAGCIHARSSRTCGYRRRSPVGWRT